MIASKKPSKRTKKPAISEFACVALRAMERAQRAAARENARHGLPLIVVKNGKIVEMPAEAVLK